MTDALKNFQQLKRALADVTIDNLLEAIMKMQQTSEVFADNSIHGGYVKVQKPEYVAVKHLASELQHIRDATTLKCECCNTVLTPISVVQNLGNPA